MVLTKNTAKDIIQENLNNGLDLRSAGEKLVGKRIEIPECVYSLFDITIPPKKRVSIRLDKLSHFPIHICHAEKLQLCADNNCCMNYKIEKLESFTIYLCAFVKLNCLVVEDDIGLKTLQAVNSKRETCFRCNNLLQEIAYLGPTNIPVCLRCESELLDRQKEIQKNWIFL